MGANFALGYILDVEGPLESLNGPLYKHKKTGEWHTGWYHCGCCGRDGFMSVYTPTCTGCSNKLKAGKELDSPVSVEHIREYCDWVNSLK